MRIQENPSVSEDFVLSKGVFRLSPGEWISEVISILL